MRLTWAAIRQHPGTSLLVLFVAVTSLCLWVSPPPVVTFAWELATGLGFAALAILLLLNLATGIGLRHTLHRRLGWLALITITAHALVYLWQDPITIEYLKLKAPIYMLAGLLATAIAVVGALVSLPRWQLPVHGNRRAFRRVHRWMSWLVLVGSTYHIAATQFYFAQRWQQWALAGFVLSVLLIAGPWGKALRGATTIQLCSGILAVSIAAFISVRYGFS